VETFLATIRQLGINPYVSVPRAQLAALFVAAGRETSPIPIQVGIGEATFRQNLVRYQGAWRLYLNTPMRAAAGKEVGQRVALRVAYDPEPRVQPMPAELESALARQPAARAAFEALVPSRQKEISRYLSGAKTVATRDRNVEKVIDFLLGKAPAGLVVLTGRRNEKRAPQQRPAKKRSAKPRKPPMG
jgi:hypothetical protein